MRRALLRSRAPLAAAAAAVSAGTARTHLEASNDERFKTLRSTAASQRFMPNAPYPDWDSSWDYRVMSCKDVAKQLGHQWPITDYSAAIRELYAVHSDKSPNHVEKLIKKSESDLPALYLRAYREHAFGGAATRHIILVRHGQYEEQRELSRRLRERDPMQFNLEELTQDGPTFDAVNAAQVLTALGRQQAALTGDRLAAMLKPALTTPGREHDVRIHVSSLTRAKETADIIASRLPSHVQRLPPDPNLAEGCPMAHDVPHGWAEPDGVHVEGARIEAAFRRLFYRAVPRRDAGGPPPLLLTERAADGGGGNGADGGMAAAVPSKPPRRSRHEYEIVVCHMNVIRYFLLRSVQLPPEAWLRFGGFNGGITHIKISPTGNVSVVAFGDAGHLSLDETTFGRHQGWE